MENNTLEAKKLEILKEQLKVHKEQDKRAGQLMKFAMILTGLLYFMFEKHLFLGEAMTWGAYFHEWHSALDFILMFIIVIMSAVFLAWVKHHAYLHFGLYGSIGLIVFTVIGFALFAEFFSSSASQDTKSRVLLSSDKAYQSTLAPVASAPALVGSGNAEAIAKAEQKLAQCNDKLSRGKTPHCKGDQANLDSLKASNTQSLALARQVANDTQKMQYDRQDKLKADSYNAVIVSIAQFIGGADYANWIKTATVLVMLLVAIAFEILHHFLSHAKERSQNAVYGLELELAKYDGSFIPEKPESVIPKNDGAFKQSGIGFTAPIGKPTTAHYSPSPAAEYEKPVFKYQQEKQDAPKRQSFGFMPSRQSPEAQDAENRKRYPQTIIMPVRANGVPPEKVTYRQELRKGEKVYSDTPLDAPSKQTGTVSKHPLEQTVYTVLEQSGTDDTGTPADRSALEQHDDLYQHWKDAVKGEEIAATARACRDFVAKHRGVDALSMRQAKYIWNEWGKRAVSDNILIVNPEYSPGNRKLKYIIS